MSLHPWFITWCCQLLFITSTYYKCRYLCWSRVVKLAAITQVDWGFLSPWITVPLFAPLNRSMINRLMSLFDCGSSTPRGIHCDSPIAKFSPLWLYWRTGYLECLVNLDHIKAQLFYQFLTFRKQEAQGRISIFSPWFDNVVLVLQMRSLKLQAWNYAACE